MSKADLGYFEQTKSRLEDHHEQRKNENIAVVTRRREDGGLRIVKIESLVKQELDEETDPGETKIHENPLNNENASRLKQLGTEGDSIIGQLKVRPLASLANFIQPTPSLPEAKPVVDDVQNPIRASATLRLPYSSQMCFDNGHPSLMQILPQSSTFRLDTLSATTSFPNSFLAVENAISTNCLIKKEIDIEKTEVSLDTTAEVVPVCSASTMMSVIVKPELDLCLGKDQGQPNPNRFLTSDAIYSSEQSHSINLSKGHSVGSQKIEVIVVDPYQDVDASDLRPRSKRLGKHMCKACDFRYDELIEVKYHLEKLHSAKYNFRCFICTTAAFNRKKSPYDLPAYKLPSLRALEFHVATAHRGEKRCKCPMCDRHFKTKKAVKNHMESIHHVVDPLACRLCSVKCNSPSALENHYSNNHDATLQECPICKKMVKRMVLANHIRQHYNPSKEQKKMKCEKCDFSTANRALLRRHYHDTKHNKLFYCELCRFGSHIEEDLKNHMNTKHHTYVCEFPGCDKTFNVERAYTTHSRFHLFSSKRKVFSCVNKDCDFQTLAKCDLVRHNKKTKHHLPFGCPDCTARYSKDELVASHIQRVHVEKIVREQEFNSQVEDISGATETKDSTNDVGVCAGDPYEHFKKGWLGISCSEDEKQQLDPMNVVPNSFPTVKPQRELLNYQSGFGHIIPGFSNETSDFSAQNHNDIKLYDGEHPCNTGTLETMMVTPSIDLNYATDGENRTSIFLGVRESPFQVDNFMFKTNPGIRMPSNISKIQPSENDNIIVTLGLGFHTSDINDHSCIKVDEEDLHSVTEAHETMIVTPSIDFSNSSFDSDDKSNIYLVNRTPEASVSEVLVGNFTIKPDPDVSDVTQETESENMIVTPNSDSTPNHIVINASQATIICSTDFYQA